MTHILTFVSSSAKKPLGKQHFKDAQKIMAFYDMEPGGKPDWLAKKKAADLKIPDRPGGVLLTHLRDMLAGDEIDLFVTDEENRRKRLLLADMDSTIVRGETLDELAALAELQEQVSEITEAAMAGRLDFRAALRERVALLKGLEDSALAQTLEAGSLNPGAYTLVHTMKKHGATCVLVSGGFTFFTEKYAEQAGFDHHHGNILNIENGKLAGTVAEPILDKFAKIDLLDKYCKDLDLTAEETLAIGDGANDIPMLKKAALGIGYHPKDVVAAELNNVILYGDLTAALYAQGYKDKDFARS